MSEDGRRDTMQRVRVGLTGLAVVLVIIALATALFKSVDRVTVANVQSAAVENASDQQDEPLADLGMAPGAPHNGSQPSLPER